jgi:hypothetical protein
MKTLLDPGCRARLSARFRSLSPETPARWGRLTAPRMVVHLSDQIRSALGDIEVRPRPGVLSWPLIKPAVMYWVPWPRGKLKSSPELFLTPPAEWNADLATLEALLERFAVDTRPAWPDHPLFGSMTHESWGRFSHRHIDHHLRQFGA